MPAEGASASPGDHPLEQPHSVPFRPFTHRPGRPDTGRTSFGTATPLDHRQAAADQIFPPGEEVRTQADAPRVCVIQEQRRLKPLGPLSFLGKGPPVFHGGQAISGSFIKSLVQGFGGGVGFMLALLMMASIRERLDLADVPPALRGAPIAFLVAALMSMAFLGFTGLFS